jgi:hypothetical protein
MAAPGALHPPDAEGVAEALVSQVRGARVDRPAVVVVIVVMFR